MHKPLDYNHGEYLPHQLNLLKWDLTSHLLCDKWSSLFSQKVKLHNLLFKGHIRGSQGYSQRLSKFGFSIKGKCHTSVPILWCTGTNLSLEAVAIVHYGTVHMANIWAMYSRYWIIADNRRTLTTCISFMGPNFLHPDSEGLWCESWRIECRAGNLSLYIPKIFRWALRWSDWFRIYITPPASTTRTSGYFPDHPRMTLDSNHYSSSVRWVSLRLYVAHWLTPWSRDQLLEVTPGLSLSSSKTFGLWIRSATHLRSQGCCESSGYNHQDTSVNPFFGCIAEGRSSSSPTTSSTWSTSSKASPMLPGFVTSE